MEVDQFIAQLSDFYSRITIEPLHPGADINDGNCSL